MKKYFLLFIVVVFSSHITKSQCAQTSNKVLVLGDSWAAFCWQYNVHNINFDKYGFSDYKAYSTGASVSPTGGTPDLSQSGSQARNYLTPLKRTVIQTTFANNPDIKFASLSLGGNDFLNNWDTTWTQTQINTLSAEVLDSITSIINFLKQQKPDIKILLSGYDYPNFEESINGSTSHPFYSRWAAMLKPRFNQINGVLGVVNTIMKNYALTGSNLYFVDNLGLMQYVYGQTTPLLFPPGGTYAPMTVPFPGGNVNYPSPLVAMNTYIVIKDAFHLSAAGFTHFVENHVKGFYFNAFRNYDATTLNETLKSGYVNSTGGFSDTSVVIGNINSNKHVGLLSFKIPVLNPSKTVGTTSIFIKRKSLLGTNPIGTYSVSVEMKIGDLGSSAFPDNSDFTAVTDATTSVCQFGSVSGNNYWLRLDLPQTISQQLVSNQTYQFRVGFVGNDTEVNQALEFYSDANASNSPFLDIKYDVPLTVETIKNNQITEMMVYPNPSNGNDCSIVFTKSFSGTIEVFDIIGKKVTDITINDATTNVKLNIHSINNGIYFLVAKDKKSNLIAEQKILISNK